MPSSCLPIFAALVVQSAASDFLVWPPPQHAVSDGPPLPLTQDFSIRTRFASASEASAGSRLAESRLFAAVHRYTAITAALSPAALRAVAQDAVHSLDVVVLSQDPLLGQETRYDYNLTFGAGALAEISAFSVYGAIYALETFVQLIGKDGNLRYSTISIRDAPQYKWRGLMIDSGRRFFPMPLVRNLLDTMAANKMNVLHLHASDMCRFGVESKVFPNLTASLTDIHAGFYTQQDIKDMISYAGARGIRVVPEFDVPGHARGLRAIESEGVEFCTDLPNQNQIFGDAANHTFHALQRLFKEMAGLFTDEVFNIGCDETSAKGKCTVQSTFQLERQLLQYISTELGKTPAGWEEVMFDASAATPNTIVDAWARHTPSEITATGRFAIQSAAGHFYFTEAAKGGPDGWHNTWYEIDDGVPAAQKHLLLGGEMSMWSDTYCYINQCGAFGGGSPVGHELFDPKNDVEFGHSIGGMIWPRGYVGAAAFWNYNSSVDPKSPAFTDAIWRLNDQLAARGSWVCPSNCSCNQLEACGKPYLKPMPPHDGNLLAFV